MKKLILITPLIAILMFGFSMSRIVDQKMKGILDQLRTSESEINEIIFSNSASPSFYFPNPKKLKELASGEKAALVPIIGDYVKLYTKSDDFMEKYLAHKELKKPSAPEPPQSAASIMELQRTEMKKGIENLKNVKASMPADQHAAFDESIKSLEEQLKSFEDPNSSMLGPDFDKTMQQNYQQQLAYHEELLAKWEKDYPADPKPMIKKWLTTFLENSRDVDYNAKTIKNSQGQYIFENPEYEKKPSLWKLWYRSGKETVDVGRTYAKNWLKELQ